MHNTQLVKLLLRNHLITLSLHLNPSYPKLLNLKNTTMGGIGPGIYFPVQLTENLRVL